MHPDFTIWLKLGRIAVNRGRNRDCVTGAQEKTRSPDRKKKILLFVCYLIGIRYFIAYKKACYNYISASSPLDHSGFIEVFVLNSICLQRVNAIILPL